MVKRRRHRAPYRPVEELDIARRIQRRFSKNNVSIGMDACRKLRDILVGAKRGA